MNTIHTKQTFLAKPKTEKLTRIFASVLHFFVAILVCTGPGWRSQYGDSPPSAGSGFRKLVRRHFSAHVQSSPEAHPASYTMGNGSVFRQ